MSNNEEVIAAAKRLKQYHNDGFIRSEFRGDMNTVLDSILPAPTFVLPKKMWAQVVDNKGNLWTLFSDGRWFSLPMNWMTTPYLATVPGLRVISEGVDE
jgi:hypothetical protein